MSDQCIICGKDVPDYEPEMCCSGWECGCLGLPLEPPLCSIECGEALSDWGNKKLEAKDEKH